MLSPLTLLLALQGQAPMPASDPDGPGSPTSVAASIAPRPPLLDGRDDEPAWRTATVIGDFREVRPNEGGAPLQRTEARVLYDPHYLYIFVRAYDTHPDSIVGRLSRRDEMTASDFVIVMIDSYLDHRSGYEFIVNPAGVKADQSLSQDGNEDPAWDGIWDVATAVDSLGWTAEYRIPFSQLRFAATPSVTFGFAIWRTIQRHTTSVSWPLIRTSQSGFVSQFGELTGLENLAPPRRGELTPYLVGKSEPDLGTRDLARRQALTVGGDLRYAVASNLTLRATVNPDFGQVEADPAELNLSAFETFFSERRPFFVEGGDLFSLRVNCFVVNDCQSGEQLFYSRRIGRAPSLADRYGDASSPTSTRILGAAKLTGRLANGLSVGLLDAVTDRVDGPAGTALEPSTNYAVLRAKQDYARGNGSFGLMLTGVNRALDASSEDFLHRSAYVGGLDARRRWGKYQVDGTLSASRVEGTAEAIAATQQSPVHYYQRPDDNLAYDPTRTSLTGYNGEVRFAKVGGERTRFETGYGRRSAGFEPNDLGFLRQADQQSWSTWFNLRWARPNKVYQQFRWNFNWWQYWTLEGLPTERAFNTNIHTQFTNRWWLHMGGTVGQLGQPFCDHNCTRGGPALRVDPYIAPWAGIQGDDRNAIVPGLFTNYWRGDGGRSWSLSLSPEVDFRVSDRFSTSLGLDHRTNHDDSQWFGNFTDGAGTTHYTFAHLDQQTLGLTWRLGYTFTPQASLQVYAQPFISKGSYRDLRELDDPRATAYDDRFAPFTDTALSGEPGGFNYKQFRSNLVFRWEYRPGSTLFLVWSQGRQAFDPRQGMRSFRSDLGDLFGQRADDVFLVKMSYWLNW